MDAGEADPDGQFPIGTVNRAVANRLKALTNHAHVMSAQAQARSASRPSFPAGERVVVNIESDERAASASGKNTPHVRTRRRVVLALDLLEDSGPSLEAAIALARRLDAEVAGLLIEDETMLPLLQIIPAPASFRP